MEPRGQVLSAGPGGTAFALCDRVHSYCFFKWPEEPIFSLNARDGQAIKFSVVIFGHRQPSLTVMHISLYILPLQT